MAQDIRSLQQRYDDAVAVMARSAKDMEVEGLSEVRMKELQATFDAANETESELTEILTRQKIIERLAKQEVEQALETQERAQPEGRARKQDPVEQRAQLDAFCAAMKYGFADLTNEERTLLKDSFRKVEQRGTNTQIAGTAGLGGYLVPVLLQTEMIKLMKSYAGILQVGRVRNTATGAQITFPSRNTTGRLAVLTAESAASTKQDITYTQVTMDAYKYTDFLALSLELLQDSEFDIEQEFMDAFAESFGRAMNASLTTGTGSGQPNGIVTAAGAGVTAASATAVTLGEIIDLSHAVDPAYRNVPTCGYMFNDSILAVIKKLSLAATNMGAGTWQPSYRDGAPATLNGFPYWINQGMSSAMTTGQKIMLFGDYNKYNIRMTKDMTILRNDYIAMGTGEVNFYGYARWDGELFDTTAVKRLTLA